MTDTTHLARQLGMRFGVLLGICLGLLEALWYGIDLYGNRYLSFLNWLPIIAVMVWVSWRLRQEQGGFMTLGQSFRVSLTAAVIAATVQALISTAYTQFIDTNAIKRAMERLRTKLLEDPNMTEEAVDFGISMYEKMAPPLISIPLNIVSVSFFGALVAIVIGLILQKRPDAGTSRR